MEESKQSLESCLNEFFSPKTTNDRKRQLESMLDSFRKQSGAWKQALYCIRSEPVSEYLTMYSQSIIENTIKFRWQLMSNEDQTELQSTLYTLLLQNASASTVHKCQPFVRNKMVKLLTDIGKLSWPQSQPNFFNNILQSLSSPDTVLIGLCFLKTISEEWTQIGDEATTARKEELKVCLIKQVPKVFKALEGILNAGMAHRRTGAQQTQIDEVVSLALEVATQFCSWVTLDGSLPSSLRGIPNSSEVPFSLSFVQLLSQYAVFNGEASSDQFSRELNQAVKSLNVLNEICYRKFIPREFQKNMNFIAHFGVDLLNKILNRDARVILPEQYLEKVIEFLCLLASSHFNQYDEQSAKGFLSLLLPFTFSQTETIFYYECLEIWGRLLDHIYTQLPIVTQLQNREEYIATYKQPILALANGIVQCTIKYQVIAEERFDLEDDEVEAPSLTRNIDILVKVGELLPTDSLESLITTWTESYRFFGSLQSALDPTSKTLMIISNPVEIEHFNFVVQLIGRMANIFYSDVFKQEVTLGKTLFQQLVGVYNFSQRFYLVKDPSLIIKMNCEILYSLRLWTYWLVRFHSEVILGESTLDDQQMFFELLGILTEVVFYALENYTEIDPSVLLANVNFFQTLVTSVRTQFIFQMTSVQTLIHKIHLLKESVNPEVFQILNKIVASLLLLPWQSVSQQEWETRAQLYESYMKTLLEEFVQTSGNPVSVILHLSFLNDQLELLVTENANPKKICWNVLKEVVPFLQKLSATYLRQSKVSEGILSFFSKIMEVLRQQAGAPFFESTIQGFLTLFSTENIINDLMGETESSSMVVEKFLGMLQFMVKDPSPSVKKFIGDTLGICYDHIYPVLAQRSTPDLKIPFFSLIRDTLNYRWNYFFPSLLVLSPPADQHPSPQEELIAKRLDQIIQSIGHSFQDPDLEVFRYNLATLSIWNDKHFFYSKLPGKVLTQFMTVILQVLVGKTHELLREEMGRVLHEMSAIHYIQFRSSFLSTFLQSNFPSIPQDLRNSLLGKFSGDKGQRSSREETEAIDLPSFTLILNNFIEDLRHFHFLDECRRLALSPHP